MAIFHGDPIGEDFQPGKWSVEKNNSISKVAPSTNGSSQGVATTPCRVLISAVTRARAPSRGWRPHARWPSFQVTIAPDPTPKRSIPPTRSRSSLTGAAWLAGAPFLRRNAAEPDSGPQENGPGASEKLTVKWPRLPSCSTARCIGAPLIDPGISARPRGSRSASSPPPSSSSSPSLSSRPVMEWTTGDEGKIGRSSLAMNLMRGA